MTENSKKYRILYSCRENRFSGRIFRKASNEDEALKKICAQFGWSVIGGDSGIYRVCTYSHGHFYLDVFITEVTK